MSYKIAIPSHRRCNALFNLTYSFLKKHNIDEGRIYIFVLDCEYEEYKLKFPNCKVVVGRFSAKHNKNYITDYFDQNQFIVQLDDDIKNLWKTDTNNKLTEIESLEDFIEEGITALCGENAMLYGVYPIKNGLFMNQNVKALSTNLTYCCGAFVIYLNTERPSRSVNLVEDFEWSLLSYLKDGKVLRNNRVCVEANQYTLPGGLQYGNNRNKDTKQADIMKLKNAYPEYISMIKKKDGQPDIKFITKTLKTKIKILKPPTLTKITEEVPEPLDNILNTYYTGDPIINDYFDICLNSWIKLGYKIVIHTNIKIKDNDYGLAVSYKKVKVDTDLLPAQQADIVRFNYLSNNPGSIWIDLDMLLIRRLPNIDNIISSEQPNRSGGYKTEKLNSPNIGVLKLQDVTIFKEVIEKGSKLKNTSKVSCYMNVFLKLLTKYNLDQYVAHWQVYCPLDWSNLKESFKSNKLTSKYGKALLSVKEIKENKEIIGCHLWHSFIQKYKLDSYADNSFMSFLLS